MDQVQKLLLKLFKQVGSAKARRLTTLVEKGQWGLLQKETLSSPQIYKHHTAYLKDVLCVEITRKLLLPGDTTSRIENAQATFWECEAQCAATNARLDRFLKHGPYEGPDLDVNEFIIRWRKNLSRALGKAPFVLDLRFPPGSTLTHKGKLITIPDKMQAESSVYAHSTDFTRPYFYNTTINGQPTSVRANRFFTVPKDSFKDRGCAVEASRNVMLQLSVGARMKTRYRYAYKVDLLQAPDIHRELAKLASVDGTLATVDLSNASDTVCRKLVELLLPADWWELLNSLRAHFTYIDGRTVHLNKFSSMGNGFTFELETFLFRSLCETLGSKCAHVFGDDIIIESELSGSLLAALRYFGFTPNERKTFCEGPFRESCGGDFFNGHPVRGYYMKELPDEPQKWIGVANGLRRADPSMRWVGAAWRFAVDQIPLAYRHYGPSHLGDLVIWDPDATPTPRRVQVGCSWEKQTVTLPTWRVVSPITRKLSLEKYWAPDIVASAAAYGCGPDIAYRGNVMGYRVKTIIAYGVGPVESVLDPEFEGV